jgi:hypothetical protein
MRRWLAVLLLCALLPWQSIAWAAQALAEGYSDDAAHTVTHWLDDAHHHHDDGSFHEDDSPESLQHVHADGHLNAPNGIIASVSWTPAPVASVPPPALHANVHPPPYLEGWRRPPRIAA